MTRKETPRDAVRESPAPSPAAFEERFAALEESIRRLEEGALPLEESLAVYESGVKALKECYEILGQAEKKIELLVKGAEGQVKTVPFEVQRSEDVEKAQRRKRKSPDASGADEDE